MQEITVYRVKYFQLLIFLHVSLYPVQEGGHPRIDSRSANPTSPTTEGRDPNEIPGLARVRILQSTFPPEQSSTRVSIAGILAQFSTCTDLGGGIYAGSRRTVINQNRNLNEYMEITLESSLERSLERSSERSIWTWNYLPPIFVVSQRKLL